MPFYRRMKYPLACVAWLLALGPLAAAPTQLEDPPEPFVPKQAASEADRARLEAVSLFAAGRTEQQAGNLPAALRLYQRALRFDPRSTDILREIVEVARELDRHDEALRYALLAVEAAPDDVELALGLADFLIKKRDFANALRLYEKARTQLPAKERQSFAYLELVMQIGRLNYVTDHAAAAANAFAEIMGALAKPAEFELTSAQVKGLQGTRGANYVLFAEAFLDANRPDDAERAYEKAEVAAPNPPVHAYRQARVLAARQSWQPALDRLQSYFDAHESSEDAAPYALLGELYKGLNRSGELLGRLEALRAADPKNGPLTYALADAYLAAEQWTKAEPLYVELAGRRAPGEAYRQLIQVYRRTDRLDPLLDALAAVVERSGGLESVRAEVEKIATDAKLVERLTALVRERMKAAAAEQPTYAALAVAQICLLAKQYEPAGEFFEAVLKTRPKAAAELVQAWALGLLTDDQYEPAARLLRRSIADRLVPNDSPAFYNLLSFALEMCGQTDEALEAAKKAIELSDEPAARAHSRVPWILYHAGRYPAAEAAYRALLERFDADFRSGDVREVMRESRLNLSHIFVLQRKFPQAEEWLEQVLDEFPDDSGAMNDLGYLWADQGKNLDRALQMIQRAVADEPDNWAYRDSLGWALYRLGRYDEALVEMKRAAADRKADGEIHDHLGDILAALKQPDAAREAWNKALDLLRANDEKGLRSKIEAKLKKLP